MARFPVGASGFGRFAVLPGASPSSISGPLRIQTDLQDQVGKGSLFWTLAGMVSLGGTVTANSYSRLRGGPKSRFRWLVADQQITSSHSSGPEGAHDAHP